VLERMTFWGSIYFVSVKWGYNSFLKTLVGWRTHTTPQRQATVHTHLTSAAQHARRQLLKEGVSVCVRVCVRRPEISLSPRIVCEVGRLDVRPTLLQSLSPTKFVRPPGHPKPPMKLLSSSSSSIRCYLEGDWKICFSFFQRSRLEESFFLCFDVAFTSFCCKHEAFLWHTDVEVVAGNFYTKKAH
jgi:hypothetical protein